MKTYIFKTPLLCNKQCDFCVTNAKYSEKRYVYPIKKFVYICSVLKSKGYTDISIEGGEPSMLLNLPQIVLAATKLGIETSIITNGSYMDDAFLAQLKEAGVSNITYSLHSHNESTHDTLVGIQGSFQKIISSIHNCLDSSISISTNTVICSYNHDSLHLIIDYISSLGVKSISFCCLELSQRNIDEYNIKKYLIPDLDTIKASISQIKKMNTLNIKIDNLPFCIFTQELLYLDAKYGQLKNGDFKSLDVRNKRSKQSKQKSQLCKSCIYNRYCDGLLLYFPIESISPYETI